MYSDEILYLYIESLVAELKKGHKPEKISTGVFGAMMEVELVNDGPVTLELDSESSVKRKEIGEK